MKKSNVEKSAVTSVRLNPKIFAWLSMLSKKTARTKSYYINEALREMMEDWEDVYDAKKILSRIKSGKEKTIPAQKVYEEAGNIHLTSF